MSLNEYNAKRKFDQTPEPKGSAKSSDGDRTGNLQFFVQMHAATRLHFDFRLEMGGTLKSWAVPKGPSLNPAEQRLAVFVEDHPIEYGSFEGIIPKHNYGAGTVMVWDRGTFVERGSKGREDSEKALLKGLAAGHITFVLQGQKLAGEFALVRLKKGDEKSWLLIKKRDAHASRDDVLSQARSVKSGRTLKEIASESEGQGDVWVSSQTVRTPPEAFKVHEKKPAEWPRSIPDPSAEPVRERMPRKVKPLLPSTGTSVRGPKNLELLDQEGWIFEPYLDGKRAIAEVEKGRVHLYSRQGIPFTYVEIVSDLRKIPMHLVLDGEISGSGSEAVYDVFDLLHDNGWGVRSLPAIERKRRLKALPIFGERVRYREHTERDGKSAYLEAQAKQVPALLAKDSESTYRGGTSRFWQKIKIKAPLEAKAHGQETESTTAPTPLLTHVDKIYWPQEGRTKGDVIEYYRSISKWILPHLRDRPESLHRHPDGILGESFFHKDQTGHIPKWVETETIYSGSSEKSVHYLLCQNEATLLYMANLGCIELNPWISRVGSLDHPDCVVIDLDPDDSNSFEQVIEVAQAVHRTLKNIGAMSFCKTSGATGLHICIPTAAKFDYETTKTFAESICSSVHSELPDFTSLERSPSKRRGRIYLDFLQNRRGQTLAAPYCIRPRPGAPVSTPLDWSEVKEGLHPDSFHIGNIVERIQAVGDLWKPMLTSSVDIGVCLRQLKQL